MRFLKLSDHDDISLTTNLIEDVPAYAILSHTWRADGDEVTFDNLQDGSAGTKAGYQKIAFCITQARRDELEYFWLDTCCIDRANHADLSEAVNSMYRWYRDAAKCYVYLSDVSARTDQGLVNPQWEEEFRKSRWFTRGWTLQELIAPSVVEFFSKEGDLLGDKRTLEQSIHEITSVPLDVLRGHHLSQFPVAERLQWAEKRDTARIEDKAYSLLGLCDVCISIIYGEGNHAYARLKEEIDRSSRILASPSLVAECMQAFSSEVDCLVQKNRNDACASGTGQWFFGHPKYQDFHRGDSPQLLFMTAEAGSGKSTVMRTLVDTLQASRPHTLITYFFFKDDNDLQRSYSEALSAMIHQLLIQRPGLLTHVARPVQQYGQAMRRQIGEMWKVLAEFATHTQDDIICVLDAIDECDTEGRIQPLRDLRGYIQRMAPKVSRLKFIVSSRPYQDRHHPYEDLISCSPKMIHLDGENAKFETDIAKVISSKVDKLVRTQKLSESTGRLLSDRIIAKNAKTKSFLWVKLAFELLETDPRLRPGAAERTISAILAAIPESIGEQFERLLQSSSDPTHARKILSAILAARRPLKIADLKVVYGLTQTPGDGLDPPRTYDDLEMLEDDGHFKTLVRNTCGLFITFVKTSVHLFHQTAREYLMPVVVIGQAVTTNRLQHSEAVALASAEREKGSWKHSITLEQANSVTAKVCLDLLNLDASEHWVLKTFRNFALVDLRDVVHNFCSTRPFSMYAACNWYEHLIKSGDSFHRDDCIRDNGAMFDISKPQFWVWFLTACDQVCLSKWSSSDAWKDEPVASVWADDKSFGEVDLGIFLRTMCLQKLCSMDIKVGALFYDEPFLGDVSSIFEGLFWTATGGYSLFDEFHLANGDWKHTSMSKAILALEHGDESASHLLVQYIARPTLIWTSMRNGQPEALRQALALTADLRWLDELPEYMLNYRGKRPGLVSSPESAFESERAFQHEWNQPYPGTFDIMIRVNTLPSSDLVFDALADWVKGSQPCDKFAQRLWEAGAFINPSACRRLFRSGAQVNSHFWRDRMTALHVAATFWEYDTMEILLSLGTDALAVSYNGYNALHWFCFAQGGPMREENQEMLSRRRGKVRIRSSLERLVHSVADKGTLIHQKGMDGITPLMLSVQTSSTITRYLLKEGAMVDQTDDQKRTGLMHFFIGPNYIQRRQTILNDLLLSEADARLSDSSGLTAVGYWAQQLLSQSLSNIYPGYNAHNINFHALDTCEVLSRANGMVDCLRPLRVPLVAAAKLGNAQLCMYLLCGGASANGHGMDDESPMTINDGSEATELEEMSWNPLMVAIVAKAYTTAALLLGYGADVSFQISQLKCNGRYSICKAGTTPVHLMVADYHQSCYTSIIHMATGGGLRGCAFEPTGRPDLTVSQESIWERRARGYAHPSERYEMGMEESDAEIETTRGGPINEFRGSKLLPFDKFDRRDGLGTIIQDPLFDTLYDSHTTCAQRQLALTELLLRRGADSNARTHENITPLLVCAQNGRIDLAELLLRYGADPNIATSTGCTALMWAARRGDRNMAELLIDRGADVNGQVYVPAPDSYICSKFESRDGYLGNECLAPITPLALAAERKHLSVVELLLDRDADPNLRIVHHAHGLLRAKDLERRWKHRRIQKEQNPAESDIDSDPEPEEWKGYWSVATALTWARGEVRELLLQRGADPAMEEPIRECGCEIEER